MDDRVERIREKKDFIKKEIEVVSFDVLGEEYVEDVETLLLELERLRGE